MPMIVADTTCGLPLEILEKRGIPVIPQIVMFGRSPIMTIKTSIQPYFCRN